MAFIIYNYHNNKFVKGKTAVPQKYPNLTLTDQIPINQAIYGKLYLKLAIRIHCLHCASVVTSIVHQAHCPVYTRSTSAYHTWKWKLCCKVTVKNV